MNKGRNNSNLIDLDKPDYLYMLSTIKYDCLTLLQFDSGIGYKHPNLPIQPAGRIYITPDISLPPRDGDTKATMTAVVIRWLQNSGSANPHSRTLLIVKVMVTNQFDRNYKDKHPRTRPGILHITFGFGVDVRF